MEEQKQIPEKCQTEEISNVKTVVSEEINSDNVNRDVGHDVNRDVGHDVVHDEGTKKKKIMKEQKQVISGGNKKTDDNDFVVKRIRFIELPYMNDKDDSIMDKLQYPYECNLPKKFDDKLFIKCGLFIIGVLFFLLVFISFLNKYRRNRQLLELRNQKKEVQLVKPEIHYNIMITPELVRKLSMVSQQQNQMKMIDEESVHEENQ